MKGDVGAVYGVLRSAGISAALPKPRGVFPLCHISGVFGMYIAIADSRAEADMLHQQAKQIIEAV